MHKRETWRRPCIKARRPRLFLFLFLFWSDRFPGGQRRAFHKGFTVASCMALSKWPRLIGLSNSRPRATVINPSVTRGYSTVFRELVMPLSRRTTYDKNTKKTIFSSNWVDIPWKLEISTSKAVRSAHSLKEIDSLHYQAVYSAQQFIWDGWDF